MASDLVMVEHIIGYGLVTEKPTFRLPAHMINAAIDGDAIEPTVELRNSLEISKPLMRFEKNVLCYIKSIFPI